MRVFAHAAMAILGFWSAALADSVSSRSQGVEDFFSRALRSTPEQFEPASSALFQETIGSRETQNAVQFKSQAEAALSELTSAGGVSLVASVKRSKNFKKDAKIRWYAKATSQKKKKTISRGLASAGGAVVFAPCERMPVSVQTYCAQWITGQAMAWVQTQVGDILEREYTSGVVASGPIADPGDAREAGSIKSTEARTLGWRDTVNERGSVESLLSASVSKELAVFGPVAGGAAPGVYGARERALLRGLDRARVLRFAIKETFASWWLSPTKQFQIRSSGCQALVSDWSNGLADVLPTVNGMPAAAWPRFPDPAVCDSTTTDVAAEDCAVKTLLSEGLIQKPANILLCEVLERAQAARDSVLHSVDAIQPLVRSLLVDATCDRCAALGEEREYSGCLQSCYQERSEKFLTQDLPNRLLQEFPDLTRLDSAWSSVKAKLSAGFWTHARLR